VLSKLTTALSTTSCSTQLSKCRSTRQSQQPPVEILANHISHIAFVLRRNVLLLESRSSDIRLAIHGFLEAVVFPAEDVVGVRAPAFVVAGGPCEGLCGALVVDVIDLRVEKEENVPGRHPRANLPCC
jgi:hypothetical protein